MRRFPNGRWKHHIYLIENSAEGLWYVGITGTSVKFRWHQHKETAEQGKGSALHKALRRFGSDNFTIRVIQVCLSRERALAAEVRQITRLKTLRGPDGCLNRTRGGGSTYSGKTHRAFELYVLRHYEPIVRKLADKMMREFL